MSALIGLVTLTFVLETGMRIASRMGNLLSKFGHARPLGSQKLFAMYSTDEQTDGQTKATFIAPLPTVGGIMNDNDDEIDCMPFTYC